LGDFSSEEDFSSILEVLILGQNLMPEKKFRLNVQQVTGKELNICHPYKGKLQAFSFKKCWDQFNKTVKNLTFEQQAFFHFCTF